MSFLRKLAGSLLSFLFTLSMLLTIQMYSLSGFTQPENLKSVVGGILQSQIPDGEGSSEEDVRIIAGLKEKCRDQELLRGEFNVSDLVIECSEVDKLEASGDVKSFVSSMMVNSIFYKEYSCGFLECLAGGAHPAQLALSKTAHDFYASSIIYMVGLTVLLGALLVALCEGLNARLKAVGFAVLWSSLPFLIFGLFVENLLAGFIPESISTPTKTVLKSLSDPTYPIYVYLSVAGFVLVFAGYFVKAENFRFARKK